MIAALRALAGLFYGMAWLIVTVMMVVSCLSEAFVDHPAVVILLGHESPFMWLGIAAMGFLAWAFHRAAEIEAGKKYPRR